MKISIIRVKPQDNLNIIIDLIKNSLNTRVFLIIAEGNDVLYSDIGLETLFKKILELGKEVVVSVPNEKALQFATNAGLVATTNQDVFTLDFKLWQKAHDLLANYKTKALYDKKFAVDPGARDAMLNGNKENSSNANLDLARKSKLVGTDLTKLIEPNKKNLTKFKPVKTDKKVNIISPTGNNLINKAVAKPSFGGVKIIIGIIFLFLLIFLGIGFWVYYRFFTKVYIHFKLPKNSVEKEYNLTAELGVEGIDLAHKKFALKEYETEKDGTITEKATKKQQDGTYATGIISVTNNDTEPIEINVGQVFVSSDNKEFKATNSVTINPNETKDVNVQAVDYGDSYNLAANQTFTLEGISKNYSAVNNSAFSGGSQREYTVVSEDDVKKALKKLKQELLDQAKVGIEDVYKNENFVLVPNSVKDITPKDEKYSLTPKLGEEATEFTLGYKVKIRALYYHLPSLESLSKELVIQDYKKTKKLNEDVKIKIEEFSYTIKSIKIIDSKHVNFVVHVKASIVPYLAYEELKNSIKGLTLEQARNVIEKNYSNFVLSYDMMYIPNWMPVFLQKVPKETGRIIVVTDYLINNN